MALSEHEQQMFEQMERELRGEIKIKPAPSRGARWFGAIVFLIVGLGAIVAGVANQMVFLGLIGFAAMLFALVFATAGQQSGGDQGAAKQRSKPKAPKSSSGSFFEDRWNRRNDI